MVKIFRLFFLLTIFIAASAKAQNISISASTDTSEYKVGDYIKYSLELKYDKNIKVFIPSVKDSVKNLEFIQALEPKKNEVNDNIIEKHTFIFSKYDSSQVVIPSYRIYYTVGGDTSKKYLAVNPVTIVVKTLQVNQKEDIRDVKEPVKLPLDWLLITLILLGVLILAAAGYFAFRYFKKKKMGKEFIAPEIIIPPHEIALKELNELKNKKLWQNGFVKEYHSELTEIVRKYFEGRFIFNALEQTSAEILESLSNLEEGKSIIKIADGFFSNADLVKFAKFQPMPNVNDEMMNQAYQIVNDTIPKPKKIDTPEVVKEVEDVR
jgi:hypothetical protein